MERDLSSVRNLLSHIELSETLQSIEIAVWLIFALMLISLLSTYMQARKRKADEEKKELIVKDRNWLGRKDGTERSPVRYINGRIAQRSTQVMKGWDGSEKRSHAGWGIHRTFAPSSNTTRHRLRQPIRIGRT